MAHGYRLILQIIGEETRALHEETQANENDWLFGFLMSAPERQSGLYGQIHDSGTGHLDEAVIEASAVELAAGMAEEGGSPDAVLFGGVTIMKCDVGR